MTGKIHSFQSLGAVDGPGVRYVAFMHGCNLRCGYCHNIDVCKGEYREYTPDEVMKKLLNYREYFGDEGGLTVSGGEPLLQSEFVCELFKLCKKEKISTALDTSGSIFNESVKALLQYTDTVLLDIKMTDDNSYKKYIGCGIKEPLNFLRYADSLGKRVWIRHVVIGGLNDSEESILRLKDLCSEFKCIEKTELLPFKKICKTKYDAMHIEFPFEKYDEPKADTIHRLTEIITKKC